MGPSDPHAQKQSHVYPMPHLLHNQVPLETLKHNTILFGLAFSPCGYYLAAANNFGRVVVWNIKQAFSEILPEREIGKCPCCVIDVCEEAIYTIEFADTGSSYGVVLLCGTNTHIHALKWTSIREMANGSHKQMNVAGKKTKSINSPGANEKSDVHMMLEDVVAFSLRPPTHYKFIGGVETNGFAVDSGVLYAACGDNAVHSWSLSTLQLLSSFEGHDDFVHCVSVRPNGDIVSGSEDGTVKFWNKKNQKCVNTLSSQSTTIKNITPKSSSKVSTKRKEKERHASENREEVVPNWIPCFEIDATDNWLATGGLNAPTLWHIPSQMLASRPKTVKIDIVRDVTFYQDEILCVGNSSVLCRYKLNGELKADANLSMPGAYCIRINRNSTQYQVMAVCGVGPSIDLFSNFGAPEVTLSFY
eukprot:CFRG3611T1